MKILWVIVLLMSSHVMAGKKPRPTPLPQPEKELRESISQISCKLIRNGETINSHIAGDGVYGFIHESRKPFMKNSEDLRPGLQYGSVISAQFREKDLIGFNIEILKMQVLWDYGIVSAVSLTLTEATTGPVILDNGEGYSMSCQVK